MALEESFRWYGPNDTVSLAYIKQTGATSVITSLHQIPYGEAWPFEAIMERKTMLEEAGLRWAAVESVPVHEDIKTRTGEYQKYIENYQTSLINLGKAGVDVVIYNFMPVLDWVRTELTHKLADGSECLYFDPVQFAAFDIFLLQREGAEQDYSPEQVKAAEQFINGLSATEKKTFERNLIDVFPGTRMGLDIQDVRNMLAKYKDIDRAKLKEHYRLFLEAVVPVAAQAGVRLAVHPDDPPWNIMGLPRIVSCEEDIRDLLGMVDDPANGLCFCTGSYSPRADNNLPEMIRKFGRRINVAHLRSTQRNPDGSFYEANHLEGSVDMYEVVLALLEEMAERKSSGRKDWRLTYRPDHGHTMMDDLNKPPIDNPGYTAIGRLRGLAEIRGLELGILRSLPKLKNLMD
ncbi:mannonate dehydratase [Pelobacter seleniigenes]|uniref:mannonate dehydratase n=1 Tax=Pelobacter seleniigenes TaxID=407188 RepID=UPI0004A70A4F|nr:mannonate dehydratase [Pelobacter seleniigenes]